MNRERQLQLLEIGNAAVEELGKFVSLQDEKGRMARSLQPIDFAQHRAAVLPLITMIDEQLSRLERIVKHSSGDQLEEDYRMALGTYLCDVRNAMTGYEHMTRLQHQYQGFRWFLGFLPLLSSVRQFKKSVNQYMDSGVQLKALWTIYKNAQPSG